MATLMASKAKEDGLAGRRCAVNQRKKTLPTVTYDGKPVSDVWLTE